MQNRHAIVLFLGAPALVLLRGAVLTGYGALGAAFLLCVAGLLLDNGRKDARGTFSHLLQAAGAGWLLLDAALRARDPHAVHLCLAEAGIALAVLGVTVEMRVPYRLFRVGVLLQAVGDLLFLSGLAISVVGRTERVSATGWAFIGIVGALSLYAAASNLILQLSRLRKAQTGWRFRVLEVSEDGLGLKTPVGVAQIAWSHVLAVEPLDNRHLLLVLPSPLPAELRAAGLPLEELRAEVEPMIAEKAPPPERYAFILHEQEMACAVGEAVPRYRKFLTSRREPS